MLRHELGHSIIDVGEEYDGGFAYFGPNAATNLSEPIPWEQWLSDPPQDKSTNAPRVEKSVMPLQEYVWTLLNTSTPWSTTFISSGTYARHLVRFSLSGLPESSDLTVELDRLDLGWAPRSDIGLDRWHYDIHLNQTLAGGQHEVKFTLTNTQREGVAQLCSVEIIEFGDETELVHYSSLPHTHPHIKCHIQVRIRPRALWAVPNVSKIYASKNSHFATLTMTKIFRQERNKLPPHKRRLPHANCHLPELL